MTRAYLADAFTSAQPFSGNPAGVVLVEGEPADHWFRSVAAELNQAETAFVYPDRDGVRRLRWFTPTLEVALCGHATLAAAHVLWEQGLLDAERPAVFDTLSGELRAERDAERIVLDFPALPSKPGELPEEFRALVPRGVVEAAWVPEIASRPAWLVELDDAAQVRDHVIDAGALGATETGLVLTARATGGADADVVSRVFLPASGIPEDPVTGAAHCALAPYWAQRLGRTDLTGFQASPRGGTIGMRLAGERVELRGAVATTFEGTLRV